MSDLAEHERRLAYALDRIGRAVETLRAAPPAPPPPDPDETARLRAALAEERAANAELTERVRTLRRRQQRNVQMLTERLTRMTERIDERSIDLQAMRRANEELIEANRALIAAAGIPETAAASKALLAELEALRTARRAETAELEEVMAALDRVVKEVQDA